MSTHETFSLRDQPFQKETGHNLGITVEDSDLFKGLNKVADSALQATYDKGILRPADQILNFDQSEAGSILRFPETKHEPEARPHGAATVTRREDGGYQVAFESGERVTVDENENVNVYNKDGSKSQTDICEVKHSDPPIFTWRLPNGATVEKRGENTTVTFPNGAEAKFRDGKFDDVVTERQAQQNGTKPQDKMPQDKTTPQDKMPNYRSGVETGITRPVNG